MVMSVLALLMAFPNSTITLRRLDVMVKELQGMEMPIYGLVDITVFNEGGQELAMARKFDMI